MNVKVKYFDPKMPRLVKTEKGDWIDLSVTELFVCDNIGSEIEFTIKNRMIDGWSDINTQSILEGQVVVMRLGVAIELPADKKAQIIARSSTFANYGLILTNCIGAIDNKYKGDNDEWLAVFYATRDCIINRYARVCQFDIVDRMEVEFEEVEHLESDNRGGYGTSGRQ